MKFFSDHIFYFKKFYPIMGFKLIWVIFFSLISLVTDLLTLSLVIPFIGSVLKLEITELIPEKIQAYLSLMGFKQESILYFITALIISKILISIFNEYFKALLVKKSIQVLREISITKLLYSDYNSVLNFRSSDIEFAFSSEFQNISILIKTFINNFSRAILFCGYFIILFKLLGIKILLISGFYSLVVYSIFNFAQKKVKGYSITFSKSNNGYLGSLSSVIDNLRYIKGKSTQDTFIAKTLKLGDLADKHFFYLRLSEGFLKSLREPLIIALIITIIITSRSIFSIELDNITLGLAIFWRTYNSFFEYLSSYNNMSALKGSFINFNSFLEKIKILIRNSTIDNNREIFKITVSNLSAKINEITLFSNLNFELKKGESLLIIGQSGSGKSTLLNYLLGLLKPIEGNILFSDQNDKNIDENKINYGFIDQNSVVFEDTLFNNITLWKDKSSQNISKIRQLTKVFPHQDILSDLEKQINPKKISGGQKQMIAIIRELFFDNDLLILDEPTSSLDITNKSFFYKELEKLRKDKILILVSHDNSIPINFSKTISLNEFRI